MLADATVGAASTFTHAVTVNGLTNGVSCTFGLRVEDWSGNKDVNIGMLTAAPTLQQWRGIHNLGMRADGGRP